MHPNNCFLGIRMFRANLKMLLLGAALAASGIAPVRSLNRPLLQPIVIPLVPYADEHWAFRAKIKGREQLFIMDTGGGLTVLTPEAAAEVRCEPWGQLTGYRMRGDRIDLKRCENVEIDIGGTTLRVPTAGIWDFNKMLPPGAPPVAANVGLDAFAGKIVTLDIGNRQLVVETAESLKKRLAVAKEVPVQFVKEVEGYSITIALALDTPKGRIWMHLDSGDDVPLTLGTHVASALGLDPTQKRGQTLNTSLAGGVPLQGSIDIKDIIFDGNIGSPVISNWVVTMDLARERLWIAAGKIKS
jgi:hypothetical protein